jgi:hypothetical protein
MIDHHGTAAAVYNTPRTGWQISIKVTFPADGRLSYCHEGLFHNPAAPSPKSHRQVSILDYRIGLQTGSKRHRGRRRAAILQRCLGIQDGSVVNQPQPPAHSESVGTRAA